MQGIFSRGGSRLAFISAELFKSTVLDGQKLISQVLVLSM